MLVAPREIGRVLEPALEADPARVAIVAASGEMTYAELDARANRWARLLREQGVASGDRVAASLPNDLEIVAAFHGAMRLGAIWVGINEALAGPEKAFMLGDSGAKLLLCGAGTAAQLAALPEGSPAGLRTLVVGEAEWSAALAAADPEPLDIAVDPHAPAGIAYTSGTTGFPKGVIHSQWNLLLPGAYLNATRGYDDTLRKGDCFPLTILNMMTLTTLLTAQAKGTAVIMDKVSSDAVARWVREERVTVWNGPPPLLYSMAHDDRIPGADLASLREVWSGGADCPESIRGTFEAKFGAPVRSTYGLTEAPTVVAIEVPGTPHREGSSGTPLPHIEVSIRDADGNRRPAGEPGEICIGPRPAAEIGRRLGDDWGVEPGDAPLPEYRLMLGYWDRPEASAEALDAGYLRTGDAGSIDATGLLTVSDRISLMLNRGGANVYPAEVERVVMSVEGVDGCGVFGVPDERLGERVAILVQFEADAVADLAPVIDRIRAELAPYKVPELAATVADLPRNAMGKVDRKALVKLGTPLVERLAAKSPR
jgi:acyl-CoA synthetase (AMP-forming)/AMP-acid ligase II